MFILSSDNIKLIGLEVAVGVVSMIAVVLLIVVIVVLRYVFITTLYYMYTNEYYVYHINTTTVMDVYIILYSVSISL